MAHQRIKSMNKNHSFRSQKLDLTSVSDQVQRLKQSLIDYDYFVEIHQSEDVHIFWAKEKNWPRHLILKVTLPYNEQFLREVNYLKNTQLRVNPALLRVGEFEDLCYSLTVCESLVNLKDVAYFEWENDKNRLCVDLFIDFAKLLKVMHDQKWLHGDLKPEHLIVGPQQNFLIDFGHSQQCDENGSSFQIFGTEKWYSPEQKRSESYTTQSEIYVFALVLQSLLLPQDESFNGFEKERIAPIWHHFFEYCLAQNPQDRPEDFEEVIELLDLVSRKISERNLQKKDEFVFGLNRLQSTKILNILEKYKGETASECLTYIQIVSSFDCENPLILMWQTRIIELGQKSSEAVVLPQKSFSFNSKKWAFLGVLFSFILAGLMYFRQIQTSDVSFDLVVSSVEKSQNKSAIHENGILLKKVWIEIPHRKNYKSIRIGNELITESEAGIWLKPGHYTFTGVLNGSGKVIQKEIRVNTQNVDWK